MRLRVTPGRWIALLIAGGLVVVALSTYTGRSEFCGSCHDAMGEHYRSWAESSHGDLAECLDCHSEPGWVGYYHGKLEGVQNALSYWFHVRKRTKASPPGPAACLRRGCHDEGGLTGAASEGASTHAIHAERMACVRCHGDIGHRPSELETAIDCTICHGGVEE